MYCQITMAIKELSTDIQTLLSASSPIHSYKTAVEELVYNSLDANSSAIAIRLHIQDNCIQVIDNGNGITKCDMKYVGQRYMTSKTVDLNTLKCAPNNYGYRGQSLSRIVDVCQDLKITSRYNNSNNTCVKIFHKGKEKKVAVTVNRPSKGTTIEIQGFLYNLRIQKQVVNALYEIQDIKQFLERLALPHHNVSMSLRDNSKNDIIFQIHKSQNIHQTLSALYSINKQIIQELHVEKNAYKVSAFIGKKTCDNDQHWIYLNGRFMPKCRLYKIIDNSLAKYVCLKKQTKSKMAPVHKEEIVSFKKKLPFYFIFINCPYNDYDVNYLSKHCVLEFSNWEGITKLLEKLIKFYAGDIVIKEIKKTEDKIESKIKCTDTRDKIKEIMNRILCSTKKLSVSQMHNGVKGKMVKRNKKDITEIILKHNDNKNQSVKKSIKISPHFHNIDKIPIFNCDNIKHIKTVKSQNTVKDIPRNKSYIPLKKHKMPMKAKHDLPAKKVKIINGECTIKPTIKKNNIVKQRRNKNKLVMKQNPRYILPEYIEREYAIVKKNFNIVEDTDSSLEHRNKPKRIKHYIAEHALVNTKVANEKRKGLTCFHDNEDPNATLPATNVSVVRAQNRQYSPYCDLVQRIFTNQQHVRHEKESISVQSNVDGRNRDFVPISKNDEFSVNMKQKNFISSRDLLQTILNTQKNYKENFVAQNNNFTTDDTFYADYSCNQRLTYESHKYSNTNIEMNSHHVDNYNSVIQRGEKTRRFITKLSRENFKIPNEKKTYKINTVYSRNYNTKHYKNRPLMMTNQHHFEESSYSIQFSKSIENNLKNKVVENIFADTNNTYSMPSQIDYQTNVDNRQEKGTEFIYNETYTLDKLTIISEKRNQNIFSRDFIENSFGTYYVNKSANNIINDNINSNTPLKINNLHYDLEQNLNVDFESKSQNNSNTEIVIKENIDPLNVCETILNSPKAVDTENELKEDYILFENTAELKDDVLDMEILSLPSDAMATYNDVIETSHHFNDEKATHSTLFTEKAQKKVVQRTIPTNKSTDDPATKRFMVEKNITNNSEKDIDFNLRNRPRFIPKGMSPILENCFTRNACDYNLEEQYFDEDTYNNFAKAVKTNTEIFETNIEHVNNVTSKEIRKVNAKLKKDNASLNFNANDLKEAKVLGQVDNKFIAAKMKEKTNRANSAEYLILFDQHAVHERIRLENNLLDYVTESKWNSVSVDEVHFKLKHDDILYLHNYRKKFEQIGLKWSVVNNQEVYVTEIPEAIIGKHDRQVDVIMKAVKNLILEEIEVMKTQKGSISMFPKSIMDLVFSEACRYAIKFGDKLSNEDCVKLLLDLAKCKTPFQCAHGRPVMAVLTEIQLNQEEYKINMNKIMEFKNVFNHF